MTLPSLSRLAASVGVVGVLAGFVVVATGLVGPFSLAFDAVVAVALLVLLQGARYGYARRSTDYDAASVDDPPERRYRAPAPGADADDVVATARRFRGGVDPRQRDLRQRVRSAAVAALAAREGISEADAGARIDAGEWTDDPFAARFFGAEADIPLGTFVRGVIRRDLGFAREARHAVAAVARIQTQSLEGRSGAADGAGTTDGSVDGDGDRPAGQASARPRAGEVSER